MKPSVFWFLITAALALSPTFTALGSSRFPRAQRLVEHPTDPNKLLMVGPYGILTTYDHGENWYHICQQSFAFGGFEGDIPLLHVGNDDTLFVGLFASLNASSDQGCDWQSSLGGEMSSVPDLAMEPNALLAIESVAQGLEDPSIRIQESTDNGESWQQLGSDVPVVSALALDSAPSDRNRLYVTGIVGEGSNLSAGSGVLARSTDRGDNWELFAIPDTHSSNAPYVAAVDPTNADVLYVRVDGEQEAEGALWAWDTLLMSTNGGESWQTVIAQPGKFYGFALSADGKTALLGFGRSMDIQQVDPEFLGLYKLTTETLMWERIWAGSVTCVSWTARGIYVCTSQSEAGYELGFVENADFALDDANALEPLLKLNEVKGPFKCCTAGVTNDACAEHWQTTCTALDACEAPVDSSCSQGGAGGAGQAPDAGVSDAAGTAGLSGNPALPRPETEDGCGCRTARSPAKLVWVALPLLAVLTLRRRQSRGWSGMFLRKSASRRSRLAYRTAASKIIGCH